MVEELISVIVPSYNYDKFIIECLESIKNQKYSNIELVIIDDNSQDNSKALIKRFIEDVEKDKRFYEIIYIEHNENKGAHFSINEGIEHASGKYIAIINADDLYEANRFSEMIPKMIEEKSKIAFSSIEVVDSTSKLAQSEEADNFRVIQDIIDEYEKVSYSLMIKNVAISTGNMIFTKELYRELGGFREYKYIHDWDYILRASLLTEPLYIKTTHYLYRLHEDNSFRKLSDVADREVNLVLDNFFNSIKKKKAINPNLKSDIVKRLINGTYLYKYWEKNSLKLFILKLLKR